MLREHNLRLLDAVTKVRPKHNEIIVLEHLLELSFQEIHELTGTRITGLKIRAIRAREHLRALLQEDAD